MTTNRIIEIFEKMALPFKDKEGGPKVYEIANLVKNINLTREYLPGQGLIVNKQDNPRIVLVTHMDLINKFQKGFSQEERRIYEIGENSSGEEVIIGALDNTITNSIAFLVMEKLIENGITDIELFFSEGEEVGFHGMTGYLKAYPEKSENTFFVNLDVTNEGYGKDYSLEYDMPNFYIFKQIQEILQEKNGFCTGDRVCDDTDAVLRANCSGFSFCLPTGKTIHSYKNNAPLSSLEKYSDSLYLILKELKFEESFENNFKGEYLKLATKTNSFKKLKKVIKKKEKKAEKKRKSYFDNYFRGSTTRSSHGIQKSLFSDYHYEIVDDDSLIGFDEIPPSTVSEYEYEIPEEDPESPLEDFSKKVIETLVSAGVDSDLIFSFFWEHILRMEGFSLQELMYASNTRDLAEFIVDHLETNGLISEMQSEFYIFQF